MTDESTSTTDSDTDTTTDITSDGTASDAAAISPAEADHRTDLVPEDGIDEHGVTADAAPLAARAPVTPESPAFSDFDIHPDIVRALADVGIERTFAIQELTLPIALAGNDLIGQARTGTGKTLGFGVPLLNRIDLPGGKGALPQALVVAPTRELAVQVAADLTGAAKHIGARVVTIYGGRAYEPQIEALKSGVRRRRRHAWSPARPRRAGPPEPVRRAHPRARRGRRDARPRLPARHREAAGAWCRPPARPCCSRPPCRARSSRSPGSS